MALSDYTNTSFANPAKVKGSKGAVTAGQSLFPSTSGVDTALTGIDSIFSSFFGSILPRLQKQAAQMTKRTTGQLRKQNAGLNRMNRSLLAELQANPEPSSLIGAPPSLSSAEVQQAAQQQRIDAVQRRGFRASLLTGSTTATSPSLLA